MITFQISVPVALMKFTLIKFLLIKALFKSVASV